MMKRWSLQGTRHVPAGDATILTPALMSPVVFQDLSSVGTRARVKEVLVSPTPVTQAPATSQARRRRCLTSPSGLVTVTGILNTTGGTIRLVRPRVGAFSSCHISVKNKPG